MALLSTTKLVLVLLNKTLDCWLQLLDSALTNLLDLVGLPAFSADLL